VRKKGKAPKIAKLAYSNKIEYTYIMELTVKSKPKESFYPTVATVKVGDRVMAHGVREIPFPRVAVVTEKKPAGGGNYQVKFRIEGSEEEYLIFVDATHPIVFEPPF